MIGSNGGGAGDARLELCFLVCEFVVDRTFDLPRLLQQLNNESKGGWFRIPIRQYEWLRI